MTKVQNVNDVAQLVQEIAAKRHLKQVYVFGSFARGEQREGSDVDMIITGPVQTYSELWDLQDELTEALHRPVDLFTWEGYQNFNDKEKKQQVANEMKLIYSS